MISVFDTYISSVLCFKCKVWGFHKPPDIERVHINFCKRSVNVRLVQLTLWYTKRMVDIL